MLAHYLISSEERGKLDDLSQIYLDYEMIAKQKNIELNERDYTCEQADIIFQLYPLFKNKLKEDNLENLFYNVEMPLSDVLFAMEKEGIKIDKEVLKKYSLLLQERRKAWKKKSLNMLARSSILARLFN